MLFFISQNNSKRALCDICVGGLVFISHRDADDTNSFTDRNVAKINKNVQIKSNKLNCLKLKCVLITMFNVLQTKYSKNTACPEE